MEEYMCERRRVREIVVHWRNKRNTATGQPNSVPTPKSDMPTIVMKILRGPAGVLVSRQQVVQHFLLEIKGITGPPSASPPPISFGNINPALMNKSEVTARRRHGKETGRGTRLKRESIFWIIPDHNNMNHYPNLFNSSSLYYKDNQF